MQAVTETELIRLQQIVIVNPRFTKLGWRMQEGFIGEHDRRYGTSIPDHILLYSCVQQTIEKPIPEEIAYLGKYDRLKYWLDNEFDMPDKIVALLVRFLEQGNGKLSERAQTKEFQALTSDEVVSIENKFNEIFTTD
jgi:hypothetical protein